MRHVVVGAGGFIGKALLAALPNASGYDLPDWDVRDPRQCNAIDLAGATVWHLAAINSATALFYEDPELVLDVQIRGTLNMLDACREQGAHTFVLFSSSEVFQDATTPTHEIVPLVVPDIRNPRFSYGGSKIAAELMVHWSALPRCLTLRPFNAYGGAQKPGHIVPDLIRRIDETPHGHSVEVHGPADARRAFIYIDDFVAGCVAIAEKHAVDEKCRETYNVGAMASTSIGRLAELLSGVMGREDVLFSYGPAPHGSVEDRCPDTSKIRFGTGWGAKVGLREGLARTVAAYREAKG